jgi:hypothetical protein
MMSGMLLVSGAAMAAAAEADTVRVVKTIAAQAHGGLYTGNRPPLAPSPLLKLPIGSIVPRGWLRRQLELEAEGMTGRLAEISPWCEFASNAWADPTGKGHSGWEELPYWLKGYGDLGYVLRHEGIIAETRRWLEAVMASQRADGWFGPTDLLTSLKGKPDLWPHMVMLNVLQSYHEFTGDPRALAVMTRYAAWQNALPASAFAEGYWPRIRAGDNLESAFWLYNRTGEPWLLDLAAKVHQNMAPWHTEVINWHNVNLAQGFRAGTVFGLQSLDPAHFESAERNYRQLMGLYGQFPGGGFVGDENCRPGYVDPRGGIETCGIVEFMHSFQMLTRICGDPLWADRCEEIASNSFPASLSPDLKALHYITSANQVQLDRANKAPGIQNGGNMFAYSPFECYRCCQHNVSHGWPYYAEELWLATHDCGLCASLYSACEVTARVGEGTPVTVIEETDYPFGDEVRLRIQTGRPVRFPLYLRVPRWCTGAEVELNGQGLEVKAGPLSYVVVSREWRDGDSLRLRLPMALALRTWEQNQNAVSVHYGPLAFSLKIGERWQAYGSRKGWSEWEVFPTTPWNYGLLLEGDRLAAGYEVLRKPGPLAPQPFTPDAAPLELRVKARRIPEWQLEGSGLVGKLQPSPALSEAPEEVVTLIPMGAARLRISAFPVVSSGPNARRWQAPPPLPLASHCCPTDTVEALHDGLLPKTSNDHGIPRFTWWDHRGTEEWVEYRFSEAREVSGVEVYWFDDTGVGQCRVPASWTVLYRQGDAWQPAQDATAAGVGKDAFNSTRFRPVTTTGLRLSVRLQDGFSGGILEWRVLP